MKKRMLALVLTLVMVLTMLPATALAAPQGGTVERIQDTDTWFADATKAFDTRETFWNDVVTEVPAGYAVDASAKTVSIGSAEALVWWAKQVNGGESFAGYTVNITADLDLSAHYWTPICTGTVSYTADGKYSIANNFVLDGTAINGNGHTIRGLATQTGVRGPNQGSKPGDGQNCFYDAAFIGYSCCDVTVQNLTFDGARIAITEPFEEVVNTYGSSMLAVVVGAQVGGSLTLENVTVNDADVLAMQKASAFVGNLMGGSTLTVEKCAITNSRFTAYFMVAPIAAYSTAAQVTVDGIQLDNNQIRMVDQSWATYVQDADTGAWYINDGRTIELNASATTVFFDGSSTTGSGREWLPVAEVDGYQYGTVASAIAAAETGDTVKLLCDVNEDVTIPSGKNVILDLNGNTLTNVSSDTITVEYGAVLSITGSGTVDNKTNAKAAVFNNGTVTLNGGTYDRTSETGVSADISGDNSWYTICNHGNMTINADVTVKNTGSFSSMIANGYYSYGSTDPRSGYVEGTNAANPSLTINGGCFIGGLNSVKNDDGGILTIENGTFTNTTQAAVLNWNKATINGGTFAVNAPDQNCILNGAFTSTSSAQDLGSLTINGGSFTSPVGTACVMNHFEDVKPSIAGGYFTADPSAYVAEGKAAVTSDNGDYAFMVVEAADTEVEAAVGTPSVTMGDNIAEADKATVETAVESVTVASGELAAAANVAVGNVTEAEKETAEAALKDSVTVGEDEKVTVYAQTYLDITPTAYNAGSDLTLEIKPMYRVVASTATSADQIDLEGDDKNAVVLENSEKEVTGVQNMTISITLPTGFPTVNLYVKHTKDGQFVAYHATTVSGSTLTFTNDKGFSTFEIAADSRTATVTFGSETLTLTPADIGKALPTGTAPSGQVFGGWTFKDVEGATGTYTTLTDELLTALNGKTVTATAYYYTPSSGTTYAVTVEKAENGKVSVSSTRAAKGSTVTVTVTPDEGYALSQLTVTDGSGKAVAATKVSDTKYTFKMPASKVTVKAVFEKAEVVSTLPFTDVSGNAWYYEAVKYAYEAGMMNGTSETKFSPDNNLTRGMIVTILWRLEEQPQVNYLMTFDDVAADQWYTEAVRWAAAEGIVTGYDANTFGPNNSITREQLAAILYRYAQYKKYDVSVGEDTNILSYMDFSQIHEYAIPAFQWACGSGVITGVTDSTLVPGGTATRAQVATMLMRFCENIAK